MVNQNTMQARQVKYVIWSLKGIAHIDIKSTTKNHREFI